MSKVKIKGKTYTYANFLSKTRGQSPEWVKSKTQKKLEEIKRNQTASYWNVKTKENLVLGDGLTGVTHVFNKGGSKVFKKRQDAKDYVLRKLKKNRVMGK